MKLNKLQNNIINKVKMAKKAWREMAGISTQEKNSSLRALARGLIKHSQYLIRENKKDLQFAKNQNYTKALIDRLTLNKKRIGEMARSLLDTAKLKDPVGEIISTFKRPNGLIINKVRASIGVIGIIYESRPNVTSDCAGLCLKSGNGVILKGGKEAFYSNKAIFTILNKTLKTSKIPSGLLQFVDSIDRQAVHILLEQDQYVDLIVPRGGEGLIRFIAQNSRIPVVKHYKGICHTYVSDKADLDMARAICVNAKAQRPGVCNAMETMLVHQKIAKKFLPKIFEELLQAGVEIRGCSRTRKIMKKGIKQASVKDWEEEYLDLILSVKVVDNLNEAARHINTYGSKHSDTIVTKSKKEAEEFFSQVDSACLYANASTRFTDGYQFGFGAEVGISTDKLHVRGPMALEGLTTYKYLVYGTGQIRT